MFLNTGLLLVIHASDTNDVDYRQQYNMGIARRAYKFTWYRVQRRCMP